tara:strand:- start:19280 stop:23572 length:4293 start_codon:yes stop_codon:yes gene_type:complete
LANTSSFPPYADLIQFAQQQQWNQLTNAYQGWLSGQSSERQKRGGLLLKAFQCYKTPNQHHPLDDLQDDYPHIARLLRREKESILHFQLNEEERNTLQRILLSEPSYTRGVCSLLSCYQDPRFPPQLLHQIEQRLEGEHGETICFREIEKGLTRHRLWTSLRDFYLRFVRRCESNELREEANHKALTLSLSLAPHPHHTLQLFVQRLNAPETTVSQEMVYWVVRQCRAFGWQTHLRQLLDVLKGSFWSSSELQAAKSERVREGVFSEDALEHAKYLERFASQQPDPKVAQRCLIEAAQIYVRSAPEKAIESWSALFRLHPRSPELWQEFYNAAIPAEQWGVLDALLPGLPDVRWLPSSPALVLQLLRALQQIRLPHVEPLPFFLQAFLRVPHDPYRFDLVCETLQRRHQWKLLLWVYRLHLYACDDPLQRRTLLRKWLVLHEEELQELDQALRFCLMALTFEPDDVEILQGCLRLALPMPRGHVVFGILERLSLEGHGPVSFRLQVARCFSESLESRERAVGIYERLAEQYPNHIDVIRQWRQFASQEQDDVLVSQLLRREIELEKLQATRANLWQQLAELYERRLRQPLEAIHAYEQARHLLPGSLGILRPLAQLLRKMRRYEALLQVLQSLQMYLELPEEHTQIHLEIVQIAISPLQMYDVALESLKAVLDVPATASEGLRLLQRMLEYPAAHEQISSFLQIYRFDELPIEYQRQLCLLRARLLFALQRSHEASSELNLLLSTSLPSQALLHQIEDLASLHQAWGIAAQAMYQRIQLLEVDPTFSGHLPTLYVQLGDLWYRQLHDPHQALSFYRLAQIFAPEERSILELLERTLEDVGAYQELCELLLQQPGRAVDRREASHIYTRVALIEREHLQQNDLAFMHLHRAYQLAPEQANIHVVLREWALERGKEELVRELLQREIDAVPHDGNMSERLASLYTGMASSFERQGFSDDALQPWLNAHLHNRSLLEPLRALSRIYLQRGEPKRAKAFTQKLLDEHERLPEAELVYLRRLMARLVEGDEVPVEQSGVLHVSHIERVASLCKEIDLAYERGEHEQMRSDLCELAQLFEHKLLRPNMAMATYVTGLHRLGEEPVLLDAAARLAQSPEEESALWIRTLLADVDHTDAYLRLSILWKASGESNGVALIASLLHELGESLPFMLPPPSPQTFWPGYVLAPIERQWVFDFGPACEKFSKLLKRFAQKKKRWLPALSVPTPPEDAKALEEDGLLSTLFAEDVPLMDLTHVRLWGTQEALDDWCWADLETPTFLVSEPAWTNLSSRELRYRLGKMLAASMPSLWAHFALGDQIYEIIEALRQYASCPAGVADEVWQTMLSLCSLQERSLLPTPDEWRAAVFRATVQMGLLTSHSLEPALQDMLKRSSTGGELRRAMLEDEEMKRFVRFVLGPKHLSLRKKIRSPLYPPLVG